MGGRVVLNYYEKLEISLAIFVTYATIHLEIRSISRISVNISIS
jgi:hypothetical protein